MHYYEIWIRGTKGCFTWSSEESLQIGARVRVPFRNRNRIGIIIKEVLEPKKFKTLLISEVLNSSFLPKETIALSEEMMIKTLTNQEKILSICMPEKFSKEKTPVKMVLLYRLSDRGKEAHFRGSSQKKIQSYIQKKGEVTETELKKISGTQSIKGMVEKGFLLTQKGNIQGNSMMADIQMRPSFSLTPDQEIALNAIEKSKKPVLLFGVTGSGKTEIYKKRALSVIKKDPTAQVLFLLPEIALTTQLISEFESAFPKQLSVWHSHMNEREKIQEYERMRTGDARVLIGTRSAVWIPFQNLKLIIMDEEHEWTFKNEFAPRYLTHDVVLILSRLWNASVLFGSATPRLESMQLCKDGIWDRVDLLHQVHKTKKPNIELIDFRNEIKKGNTSPISESLQKAIEESLKRKKQIILFLNKRGISGSTICTYCGHTFECPNCSHNMKMHERFKRKKFMCHICGHMEKFPEKCTQCQHEKFDFKGWGTQFVETALQELFPEAKILRADADSVSGRYDFEKMIESFHQKEADILLGTQMIAKGLDFENVTLVGVLLADVGLSLPDFRAEERVFQLLMQVSGRAGRRNTQGEIYIQTFQYNDPLFQFVRNHDVSGFIENQQEKREQSMMPPYTFLAKLTYSHKDKVQSFKEAKSVFNLLKTSTQTEKNIKAIDFAPAFFPRTHNQYHFHIYIRGEEKTIQNLLRKLLLTEKEHLTINMNPSSIL